MSAGCPAAFFVFLTGLVSLGIGCASDPSGESDAGAAAAPGTDAGGAGTLGPYRCRTQADCGASETCVDCAVGATPPVCAPLRAGGTATTGLCVQSPITSCQTDVDCLPLGRDDCLSWRCRATSQGGVCDPVELPQNPDSCFPLFPFASPEWFWDQAYYANRCATLYAAVAAPGCADPPAAALDVTECSAFYWTLQDLCADVVLRYWDCAEHLIGADYECHADGTTGTKNGLCQTELDAIVACSPDV